MIGAAQLPQIKPGAMLVKAITKVRTTVAGSSSPLNPEAPDNRHYLHG
jgi:hypothetical protein